MILRDKELFEDGLNSKILMNCLAEFKTKVSRLNKLDDYYKGNHKIISRKSKGEFAPNNIILNNYAKYITDTACGYVLGNAVGYSTDSKDTGNIEVIKDILASTDVETHDAELEKDLSVFGLGYELVYMSSNNTPVPKLALIDPRNAFVVFDTTVERNPIIGVTILRKQTGIATDNGEYITVYTNNLIYEYETATTTSELALQGEKRHFFNMVPLIEYKNNEEMMGDFEGVISLIDAYNIMQSDRVNDKERFVDAILLIINANLEEDDAKTLAINRILQLPEGSNAEYITKSLNEAETQILVKALRDDIHKFSQVPDFSDEKFSGNSSGVAMAYKLLSLENLAKVKERFFISGLKQRLKTIANILGIKNINVDISKVVITMNRTLPVNELELAQIVTMLKGTVSLNTLLTKLPFVDDIDNELKLLEDEQKRNDERMMKEFQINEDIDREEV